MPPRAIRSRVAASVSSPIRVGRDRARSSAGGRPPAGDRRSGSGRSSAARPPASPGSVRNCSARFHKARKVSWTISSASPRSESTGKPPPHTRRRHGGRTARRTRPRSHSPAQRRAGHPRSGRSAIPPSATLPASAAGFTLERQRPPLEGRREDDLGLARVDVRDRLDRRITRSRSSVSAARILSR